MKTPAGLVGVAVVFWGWHTGLLAVAAVIAILVEGARFVPWRWDLSGPDQGRISDLSTVAFVALAIYLVAVAGEPMRVLELLPLALVALVIAQAYSRSGTIAVSAMLWARRAQRTSGWPRRSIDLSFIYVAISLMAASAANRRTPWFFAGILLIVGWALWSVRSPAYSRTVWIGVLAVAAILGELGHRGLFALQPLVEQAAIDWVSPSVLDIDAYRSITAMGRIGELKLGKRIVMRVDAGPGAGVPLLVRDATYDVYRAGAWVATVPGFGAVDRGGNAGAWRLVPGDYAGRYVTIATSVARGTGMLALPRGAFRIDGLAAEAITYNRLGAVRVDGAPSTIDYRASFDPRAQLDAAPSASDLVVPKDEAPILVELASELDLVAHPRGEAVAIVRKFFREQFRYSTFQTERRRGTTALGDFLRRSRAGHCEYFATGTVLLLRTAGIPARYATGYAVQEWSGLEQRWIVRARHAHAWALAYVEGAWHEVDSTPSVWADAERREAGPWEWLTDLWSWLTFRLLRWWTGETRARWLWAIAGLVVAIAAWKFFPRVRTFRLRKPSAGAVVARSEPAAGADSEFYAVERALAAISLGRRPSESMTAWLTRVEPLHPAARTLDELAALHCRYRFDPVGLSRDEREALRSGVHAWLAALATTDASSGEH